MASRNHQLPRLYRLRLELDWLEEGRRAAEVNGRDAAQLVVQRQLEELRQEAERLLAASMRLHDQSIGRAERPSRCCLPRSFGRAG
jgi:hypothetical protein